MGYWTIKRNITDIFLHNRFKNRIFISWKQEKTTMNSSYPSTHRYFQISNLHWRFSSWEMHRNSSQNKLKLLIISSITQVKIRISEFPYYFERKFKKLNMFMNIFFLIWFIWFTQRKILIKWNIATQIYLNPMLEMHSFKMKICNDCMTRFGFCLFY